MRGSGSRSSWQFALIGSISSIPRPGPASTSTRLPRRPLGLSASARAREGGTITPMRAETVIATHGNTDFDAFAAMLAARRLYPGAAAALSGSLNRNVREFFRLYAEELELVEATRLETDAIRRLIVVETVHASRLGDDERDLLAALLDALEPRTVAGVEVLLAAVAWPRYVDGVSNLAHKVVDVTDAKALVLLVEMDERVFCVTRSRTDEVDADAIAELLGGGGHP